MVKTRTHSSPSTLATQPSTNTMATLQSSDLDVDMAALHTQGTAPQDPHQEPEQELNFPGLVQVVNPRGRPPPPELAREVRDNRQQAGPDFVLADPNFDWNLMALPAETNFPLPCEGNVQEIAAGLLAHIPFMQGRDLHDAKFVLRVVLMWPDLTDQDRKDIFQRLNVYAIVASIGWPTAIAACLANSRSSAFYLPQGVQVVQQGQRQQQNQQQPQNNRQRQNNQRQQPQQQQRNAPAPAPAPAQQRNRRRQN